MAVRREKFGNGHSKGTGVATDPEWLKGRGRSKRSVAGALAPPPWESNSGLSELANR